MKPKEIKEQLDCKNQALSASQFQNSVYVMLYI